jgi:hypothetical protein
MSGRFREAASVGGLFHVGERDRIPPPSIGRLALVDLVPVAHPGGQEPNLSPVLEPSPCWLGI